MSQSTISRRLNGTVSPTVDELERIANAAGLELDVILRDPLADSAGAPAGGTPSVPPADGARPGEDPQPPRDTSLRGEG